MTRRLPPRSSARTWRDTASRTDLVKVAADGRVSTADDTQEVTGAELQVGDVIRCRPYRGIPGLPRFCAQGDEVEFTIGRIESTRLSGNQRFHLTMVLWAAELHEVLYVGERDIVNLVRRESVRKVVHATAMVMPEVRALPESTGRAPVEVDDDDYEWEGDE